MKTLFGCLPPSTSCLLPSAFCLLLSAFCLLPSAAGHDRDGHGGLLETGSAAKLADAPREPAEIKIVTYNIRYREGEDLRELIRLLREDAEIGRAAIVGLQEVDRRKERTGHTNTVRVLAESLGMHYAWAAPPPPRPKDGVLNAGEQEEETGVAILSPYPLTEVERIVLPNEGPNRRRRVALGATVGVGAHRLRVYSVHAETRMPLERKVVHWRAVLEDLKRYPKADAAVVLGDFNTIKGKDVKAARQLFTDAGFQTPFPDDRSTWKTFLVELKLDWVWLRGLEAVEHGIDKKVGLSDHWPLWVRARLRKSGAEKGGSEKADSEKTAAPRQ